MDNLIIKDIIINNIKYAVDILGYSLIDKDWGNKVAQCACPLGCTIIVSGERISEDFDVNQKIISDTLGVSENWICNFIMGYDGHQILDKYSEKYLPDEEAFNLGVEIRKEFSSIILEEY